MLTTIGPEIRESRERRKVALETLSLHAGVNLELLRRYELMDRIDASAFGKLPSESELERVARALRTSIQTLVKRAKKRRPQFLVITSGGFMTLEEYVTRSQRSS